MQELNFCARLGVPSLTWFVMSYKQPDPGKLRGCSRVWVRVIALSPPLLLSRLPSLSHSDILGFCSAGHAKAKGLHAAPLKH